MTTQRTFVYTGNCFGEGEDRILVHGWDGSGSLQPLGGLAAGPNRPFYLQADPARRRLYSADFGPPEEPGGRIGAFEIDSATGALQFVGSVRSQGQIPVFIGVSSSGGHVFTAHCGPFTPGPEGRTVAVFPTDSGGVADACCVVQHEGTSIDGQRQTGPHPHAILLDPADRFALVPDLGSDRILIYRFEAEAGTLRPHAPAFVSAPPGSGPRHLRFHPNGRFVYVNTEIGNTVIAYAYDAERGTLTEVQVVSTLPTDAECRAAAELRIHPSGRFLYASNRNHESIAVLSIDTASGKLTPVEVVSTQGAFPRSFALDPDGAFLLVSNERSNTLRTYSVDSETGRLSATGFEMKGTGAVEFVRF